MFAKTQSSKECKLTKLKIGCTIFEKSDSDTQAGVNIFRKIGNFSRMVISKAVNSSQKVTLKFDHIFIAIYKILLNTCNTTR